MSVLNAKFHVADYAVLVTVLLISAAIGVYYRFTGGKQSTTKEFLLADRNQHVLPVALSLVAAHVSSVSVLGMPAEVYFRGFIISLMNISFLAVFPVCVHWYIPVFFKVGNVSAYEYLERRFGHKTRVIAAMTYPLQTLFFMGLALYAPSLALEVLTGLPRIWSIVFVGCICTFYSTLGGLKAVIMTDAFQFILTNCALISIVLAASSDKGSISAIWESANEGGRTEMLNFSIDPTDRHTWWTLIIGGFFTYMSTYSVHQTQVQRYLSLKDHQTCAKSLYISMPITILFNLLISFAGLCIYSRYQNCDPYTLGKIKSQDQLLPFYLMDALGHLPGVPGLIVSGLFCASLSAISATLNSITTITVEDYIKPIYLRCGNSQLSENKALVLSKMFVVLYGVVAIFLAFLAQFITGILQAALTLAGIIGSPMLALFTLGMFCPNANEPGAISSILVGLAMGILLGFGNPKPPIVNLPLSVDGCVSNTTRVAGASPLIAESLPLTRSDSKDFFYLYRISYLWNVVISTMAAIMVGLIVSFFASRFYRFRSPTDLDLYSPLVAYFLRKKKRTKEDVDEVVIFEKPRVKKESLKEVDEDENHIS